MDAATMIESIDRPDVAATWRVLNESMMQSGRSPGKVMKATACSGWRFSRGAAAYFGPTGLPGETGRLAPGIYSLGLRNEDTLWPNEGLRPGTPEEIVKFCAGFPGVGVPVGHDVRKVGPPELATWWAGWDEPCRELYEESRVMGLGCYEMRFRDDESIRIHAARHAVLQVFHYLAWLLWLEKRAAPAAGEGWIGGRDVHRSGCVIPDAIRIRKGGA